MVGIKEIRSKILSIQNTKKITQAMEMVATSKMRRLQDRMMATRPYTNSIIKVISRLTSSSLEYNHPYMEKREIKRIGYLVISTDRGLCGNLNGNLFKKLLLDIRLWSNKNIKIDFAIIGSKGVHFLNFIQANIVSQITGIGDNPSLSKLIGPVKVMLKAYNKNYLDGLYIINNKFISSISQVPTITQLLPLSVKKNENYKHKSLSYLYEPDLKTLLDILLCRYIESQVYQNVIENLISEQAARMIAMKSATNNSYGLIKELKLEYNKSRQTNITQELIEVISGCNAVYNY